jgi:hypothetical protein
MLKEDIRVGDMLHTDIDPPVATHDHGHPLRPVLVLSLDASEYTSHEGYVVVLDCGVVASVGCMWLCPPSGNTGWDSYGG